MRKKTIFSVISAIIFMSSFTVHADLIPDDMHQFISNNPDGQKYDFVKHYLNSLTYVKENEDRQSEQIQSIISLNEMQRLMLVKNNLALDNTNLRVARNFLKQYQLADNGLMLKAVELFTEFCDEMIELNMREKTILQEWMKKINLDDITVEAQQMFLESQQILAAKRKESQQKLLQASLFVQKILISENTNSQGEFVYLGVNQEERQKLLRLLQLFEGQKFKGPIREGQSFLQASISAIREVLTNGRFSALESSNI
ncbi:MAG: hypothetical protein KC713_02655 [Candidatus Omnitrophica bacterium]|nr:hypothetical protein [Candidatus Omnitrophota bacterium]